MNGTGSGIMQAGKKKKEGEMSIGTDGFSPEVLSPSANLRASREMCP